MPGWAVSVCFSTFQTAVIAAKPFIQFSVRLAHRSGQPGSVSLWTLGTTIPFHSILRNTIIIILAHEARVM